MCSGLIFIKIEFTTSKNAKASYEAEKKSSLLNDLTIAAAEANSFSIHAPQLRDAVKLQVSVPSCLGRSYAYATISCSQNAAEISGNALKCGGLMDIKDRIVCRLNLRKDQQDEYENFFPEECRERADQEQCLAEYQVVQECWDFPNGESRINCVKRVMNLGDILTEKANCNALDSGKRDNCNANLTQKVHGLVKFRLYNLEEMAEEFLEQGKLDEPDVVEFIAIIEQKKLDFNNASSNDERKQILLDAREEWKRLLEKVREP